MTTVKVSGTSYKAADLKSFPVKPTSQIKKGFGEQYSYDLAGKDLEVLFDRLAEAACEVETESVQIAIYKDLDRFPPASGTAKKPSLAV